MRLDTKFSYCEMSGAIMSEKEVGIGVRIQAVTDEIADSLGLDRARGALVASVADGGPARARAYSPAT